jgi:hypothetical protein
MGRWRESREDLPKLRTIRPPTGASINLGALRKGSCWVWLYCRACGRGAPAALAPFIIRWGPEASGDVLRRSARCTDCGGKGVTCIGPSWKGKQDGAEPFPVERMGPARKADKTL